MVRWCNTIYLLHSVDITFFRFLIYNIDDSKHDTMWKRMSVEYASIRLCGERLWFILIKHRSLISLIESRIFLINSCICHNNVIAIVFASCRRISEWYLNKSTDGKIGYVTSFYKHNLALIPAWISKVWDKFILSCNGCSVWSLWMDNYYHHTLCNGCDYLYMLRTKFI